MDINSKLHIANFDSDEIEIALKKGETNILQNQYTLFTFVSEYKKYAND